MRHAAVLALCAALLLAMMSAGPARAQGIGLPRQDSGKPIEITAEDGIEWHRNTRRYIARGNARAAQGDVAVTADVLTAHYRARDDGTTDIWRIDASGNVRITSPTQTAYGETGVYLVEKGILVLKGDVRLVTPTDEITARDSIEYWEKRSMAVARGDAVVAREDRRLRADILTAHFRTGEDGTARIRKIDAFDNVLISSPTEIVRAKEGVYDVQTGIATLTGGVKITRGENQINGAHAEVNMNTGVSRMFAGGGSKVRGLIVPEDLEEDQPRREAGR